VKDFRQSGTHVSSLNHFIEPLECYMTIEYNTTVTLQARRDPTGITFLSSSPDTSKLDCTPWRPQKCYRQRVADIVLTQSTHLSWLTSTAVLVRSRRSVGSRQRHRPSSTVQDLDTIEAHLRTVTYQPYPYPPECRPPDLHRTATVQAETRTSGCHSHTCVVVERRGSLDSDWRHPPHMS
jgi:hypothetical protein